MIKAVHSLFFSATGTTAKVARTVAEAAAKELGAHFFEHDVTTPHSRTGSLEFNDEDLVIFAVPVYIGRVPNLIKPWLATVKGNGALGVPITVYGNRNFDDALVELYDMMRENGFICTAAATFVGEHSFSRVLGAGRPDASDLQIAEDFGKRISHLSSPLQRVIPGERPYRFFKAADDEGRPFDIRKAKPVTDPARCSGCGRCAALCPMGSISSAEAALVEGICIKCGACIKGCPSGAKHFIDGGYLRHLAILERDFSSNRCEPELYY